MTNEEFLAAEVSYWRGKYENLSAALNPLIVQHDKTRHGPTPEPPVGTKFVQPRGGIWTRKDDGWRCPGEDCNNCPTSWDEVETYVRNAFRRLPGDDDPHLWAGDDPEPPVGTVVKTLDGHQFTREASGLWHPDDGCWGLVSHCRGLLTSWGDLDRPLVEVASNDV